MKNLAEVQKAIIKEIEQAQHVLLVAHQKPDGDAAGACLALSHYLEDLKKDYTAFCIDEINPYLKFLPKSEEVVQHKEIWDKKDFDVMIILDSGDLKYAGIEAYVNDLTHDYKIINIDHHETNDNFGDYNLVISDASSTCEIIHDLLDTVNALNKNIATCLLTGLVTDTGGFSNLATTSSAIETASKLLLHGANLQQITTNTLNHRPFNALKLWGRALERLEEDSETGIVSTVITLKDMAECQADEEARDGVANFLNSLDQNKAKAIMVLTERPQGKIKVSLRTTNPLINVAEFAKLMGGGGHTKSAGFEIDGRLQETKKGWKIV